MLRIHFLGVGDGDCIVLELPDGRWGLIDSCIPAGASHSPAEALLASKQLAFACLTHPHDDHFSGMLNVLKKSKKVETFLYALSDLDVVLESMHWLRKPATQIVRPGRRRRHRN